MRTRLFFLACATAGLAACGQSEAPKPAAAPAAKASAPAPGAKAQAPDTAAPATAVAAQASASAGPDVFSYQAAGRRDPFMSLLHRGTDRVEPARKGSGLDGLGVGDVALKGIVRSAGTLVAMVQAPDNRTYLVRQNDRLRDARVKAITADAVVFMQQVTDPLAASKEREVRKPLRPSEEGK
ncbi:MAG: pilus assembly protein PilP [Vicinamibacterales bacterium]